MLKLLFQMYLWWRKFAGAGYSQNLCGCELILLKINNTHIIWEVLISVVASSARREVVWNDLNGISWITIHTILYLKTQCYLNKVQAMFLFTNIIFVICCVWGDIINLHYWTLFHCNFFLFLSINKCLLLAFVIDILHLLYCNTLNLYMPSRCPE